MCVRVNVVFMCGRLSAACVDVMVTVAGIQGLGYRLTCGYLTDWCGRGPGLLL